jgi:hypothetical protein
MADGDGTNPILYIEDLYRLPLRRHHVPAPGAVPVYLSRNGKLYCPAGGLTHGELWWRAPRRVYEVDGSAHPLELTYDLAGGSMHMTVDVTATWRVADPVAVVRNRVFDVAGIARPRLLQQLEDAVADSGWQTVPELRRHLESAVFPDVALPEGILLAEIQATVPSFEESPPAATGDE